MHCKTECFDLYYNEIDENLIDEIISIADSSFAKVICDFNITVPGERYAFFLCKDVEEYITCTGKKKEDYREWMVGWADYNLKKLCIISPRVVADRSPEDMKKVIVHEIVHIALDLLGNPDDVNIFLGEGIAVAYAEQIESEYLSLNDYPAISDIYSEDGFYENNGYNYSGVYIKHFIELYGVECFKKVYIGEENILKYIEDGFEYNAIAKYLGANRII